MGTQLILTVGKNPLPVWVACDRLTNDWWDEDKDHKIAVQFVYTDGTKAEKDLLKDYCKNIGVCVLDDIEESQDTPNQEKICKKIVNAHRPEYTNLHVHYTGGTQAMGVAAVCAMVLAKGELLSKKHRDVSTDASYLDPGRSSVPRIVSWNNLILEDTRIGIPANIQEIAKINGFQVGDFYSLDPTGDFQENAPPWYCPTPKKPGVEQLLAGQTVLDNIRSFDGQPWWENRLRKWRINNSFTLDRPRHPNDTSYREKWNTVFRHDGFDRGFTYPSSPAPFKFDYDSSIDEQAWQKILCVLNAAYPSCPWNTTTGELPYRPESSPCENQKNGLRAIDAFFNGIWLEYAAYAAFEKVLKEIKCKNSSRDNFQLYHNVYVRQKGPDAPHIAERHFELDVVAVLGYQVIVVSCSITDRISTVKQKAMEVYHRARQLGGAEARAVVLCLATYEDAERVEKELEDETGTERPLQVWGRQKGVLHRGRRGNRPNKPGKIPNMESLCDKFREFLYKGYDENNMPWHLHWQ